MKAKLSISWLRPGLVIVILLSLLPLSALLHSGLPITHDGADHVARIANFYKAFSEGVLFPRWAENLNWGYGHPVIMFLYPLSSYLATLFHFVGFSYIDSLKLVFATGYIASGITMYLWAREQFNEQAGIAASALYLFAPYRFVDLYVRGAIGEHVALIFPPLILYCIMRYFRSNSVKHEYFSLAGISFSFALLLLAHNALSIMFVPFFIVYVWYLAYLTGKYRKLFFSMGAFMWGFLLGGFFLFPAFFEGKFTLRDIVTGNEYKTRFVNPLSLLYGLWSYGISGQFSVQIGVINILGIILFPFFVLKTKKQRAFLISVFLILLLSIFLVLPQSDFLYSTITTLKKFQFPWRFLNLTIFSASILGASVFLVIKGEAKKKILLGFLVVSLIITTFSYWWARGYLYRSDAFYNDNYRGTTDTGESAPIWSVRFMEKEPKEHLEVISGQAVFSETARLSVKHSYLASVLSNEARFKDNTLYFPNWTVFANGKKVDIQFQDPAERGLITFILPKGNYKIDVVFRDTKLRVLSNMLSILSFAVVLIGGVIVLRKEKKKKGA